jgi:dephospho-CoA kinase
MLKVGLTGGIGTGKSLVADRFAARGVPVIDADLLARDAVAPGSPGLAEIRARFGDALIDASGALDRAALRARIFADPAEREALEAIIHPRVREAIGEALRACDAAYALVVVPLLFESGMQDLVDRVLVVDAPPESQVARVAARDGVPEEQVRAAIAAQLDPAQRRARADDLIENTAGPQAVAHRIAELDARYRELAAREGR